MLIELFGGQGSVELVDHMGSDLRVANMARKSYANSHNNLEDSDEKLIKHLLEHGHMSPLESVEFVFAVKAPLFVVRQWQRHRTWSYHETSRRYTGKQLDFYVPKSWRSPFNDNDSKLTKAMHEATMHAHVMYRYLLENGVPRELARIILPQSMMVNMIAKVNLRNLLHFLDLRDDKHAQWEIRCYADALKKLAATVVPVVMKNYQLMREERRGEKS